MARRKKSTKRATSVRRKTYRRRRRSSGLSGLMGVQSASKKDLANDLIEVAATAAGVFAAAKGTGMLGKAIKKEGVIPPAAITAAGVAGLVFLDNKMVKAVAKGVVIAC